MINHKDFKYKIVIDWILFEINTKSPTNFQTIKRRANLKYVEGLEEQEGKATNKFSFKVHDIHHWNQIRDIYEEINEKSPLASEPLIKAIEVSFDAYSKNESLDELKDHVEMFYKMISNEIVSNPNHRRYNDMNKAEAVRFHNNGIRLNFDKTIYMGSQKDDDITMRCYLKTKDINDDLPVNEQRTRIEVTLKGDDCPFKNLNEAIDYKFKNLAKFFKFRKLIKVETPLLILLANREVKFGEKKKRVFKKKNGKLKIRLYHPATKANTELNKIAYDKLRYLSKSLATKRVLKKSR